MPASICPVTPPRRKVRSGHHTSTSWPRTWASGTGSVGCAPAMKGREPQARGPIVVLLDESSSMREDGRDIWSKAAALALMSTAARQRRAWHLVAFNGAIRRDVAVPVGQANLNLITEALDHGCAGGTDFDAPIINLHHAA